MLCKCALRRPGTKPPSRRRVIKSRTTAFVIRFDAVPLAYRLSFVLFTIAGFLPSLPGPRSTRVDLGAAYRQRAPYLLHPVRVIFRWMAVFAIFSSVFFLFLFLAFRPR
jgi:hypothetical protein